MASLNGFDIPAEVLAIVCEYMIQEDLCSLLRVCKTFRHLAQLQLYKHIDVTPDVDWFGVPPHHHLFLMILRNPEIAPAIQSLQLGRQTWWGPRRHFDPPTDSDADLAREKMHELGLLNADHSVGSYEKDKLGVWDISLACLLSMVPNLKCLDIHVRFGSESRAFSNMLECSCRPLLFNPSTLSLHGLREVSYYTANRDAPIYYEHQSLHGARFSDFLWLFYLPSVEIIRSMAIERPGDFIWPTSPPKAATLTELRLFGSHVKEETVGEFLLIAPNLRTFQYNLSSDDKHNIFGREHLDCGRLGRSLQIAKTSLETLIISVHFSWQFDEGRHPDGGSSIRGYIGSMKNFTSLRTLVVPLTVLLGHRPREALGLATVLPRDLLRLTCTADAMPCYYRIWTQNDVLDVFRHYFDSDTSLELEALEANQLLNHRQQKELEQMTEDAGIFFDGETYEW